MEARLKKFINSDPYQREYRQKALFLYNQGVEARVIENLLTAKKPTEVANICHHNGLVFSKILKFLGL